MNYEYLKVQCVVGHLYWIFKKIQFCYLFTLMSFKTCFVSSVEQKRGVKP